MHRIKMSAVISGQVLLSLEAELRQSWLADRASPVFDFGLPVAGAVTAVVRNRKSWRLPIVG